MPDDEKVPEDLTTLTEKVTKLQQAVTGLQGASGNASLLHNTLDALVKQLRKELDLLKVKVESKGPKVDPTFSFPQYKPEEMTPEFFIKEVEEYFTVKSYEKSTWHILVSRLFKEDSEQATWWRAKKSECDSWDKFTEAFKKYETSDCNKDMLHHALYTRKQKIEEAFESYSWDLYNAYIKVHTKADEAAIVERILNSCLPELAVELLPLSCKSVEDLIGKARTCILNLNKVRTIQNLPLLRARRSDPLPTTRTLRSHSHNYGHNHGHKNNGNSNSVSSQPKSGTSSTSGSSTSPNAIICNHCKIPNHTEERCFKKKREEREQRKQGRRSGNE